MKIKNGSLKILEERLPVSSKGGYKKNRFEERLVNEINLILRTKMVDPRLRFVTVTKAEVTPDFAYATIYWDTFDSSRLGDAKKAIEKVTSKVRSMLAKILNVRHTPLITFCYDSQFVSEQKIEDILKSEAELGKKF